MSEWIERLTWEFRSPTRHYRKLTEIYDTNNYSGHSWYYIGETPVDREEFYETLRKEG